MHRRSMPLLFGLLLIAAGCGVTYADPQAPRPEVTPRATPGPLPPALTVASATDKLEELLVQQREILHSVGHLPDDDTPERDEVLQRLRDRKEQMAGDLQYLETAMDHAVRDDPEAPPVLGEALDIFRERELVAKVRYSRTTIGRWRPGAAELLEESIQEDLQTLLALLTRAR